MANLSRWLPFMFRRKKEEKKATNEAKKAEGAKERTREPVNPIAPLFGATMMQPMLSESFFNAPLTHFAELDKWFGDFSPSHYQPKVDVTDEEDALRVTAELPGMTKDDVEVSVEDDTLTVRGQKRNESESNERGVYRSERYYGHFERSIPLPRDVDQSQTTAKFSDGVLSVHIPKSNVPQEDARRVPVE